MGSDFRYDKRMFRTLILIYSLFVCSKVLANANLNAISSLIIPGLGQTFNGQYTRGAVHFSVAAGLHFQYQYYLNSPDRLSSDLVFDEENRIKFVNKQTHYSTAHFRATLNTHFYSSYAAYRDSGGSSASPAKPSDDTVDVFTSPLRFDYMLRPTTVIPLAIIIGIMASDYDNIYATRYDASLTKNDVYFGSFLAGGASAIGEEAFFRGYLNNELSGRLGWIPGGLVSSGLFGATHGLGGNNASVLASTLFGFYLSWLQRHNDYSISEGIFIHFWINAFGAIQAIEKGGPAVELVNISIPF